MKRAQARTKKGSRPAERNGPDHAATSAAIERLTDVVRPYLIAVVRLHQLKGDRRPPPEVIYQRLRPLLERTVGRCDQLRLPPEALADIRYALVAFTDEFMQLEPGPLRDFWQSRLLQLEFFGETRAGEGFFDRLERLKQDHEATAVAYIYYICLLFGFQGVYRQHGELERENLIDDVQRDLDARIGLTQSRPIAPHGARPDEPGVDRERNRLLQWLAVAAAAMSIVWYVGVRFTVDAQEQHLSQRLRHMYEDLKTGFVAPLE